MITSRCGSRRKASLFRHICLISGLTGATLTAFSVQAATISGVDFLGQATFSTGTQFAGTEVGGLSGITYDATNNVYYAISDDRSQINPARFYTLNINLSQGSLTQGGVAFTNVTTLRNPSGQTFAPLSLDPEGIALTNNGTVFVPSEGDATNSSAPFVNEFSLTTGQQVQALPIRNKFLPTVTSGIRNNLAFESLTIAPNQQSLFTATENALIQDGPPATTSNGSFSRILKYNLTTDQPAEEFLYITDPVATAPIPSDSFSTNGLVDMLALDDNGNFLSLERSFSTGVGNNIKLYEVSLEGASDIQNIQSLSGVSGINPVEKTLLLDFSTLGVPLDNIEGLTFGPDLADGRRSLVVVSDNNFSPTQTTQILAFGVRTEAVPEPSSTFGLLAVAAFGAKRLLQRKKR